MTLLRPSILAIAVTFALPTAWAQDVETLSEGDIYLATLADLMPTQPSVGYDQIYYKLGRYQHDIKKQFDEICEANGQKGISDFNEESQPAVPESFKCEARAGQKRKDMKTVVIAPDNTLYLTDGHHTFNTFWHMAGGGSSFKINVLVDKDYRHLKDMGTFWQQLEMDKNTWLFDLNNQAITSSELPSSLGMPNFSNDPFRSLMYFSRGVSWNKPKQPVPFLEFYWAKELKPVFDLNRFDLDSQQGYMRAVQEAAEVILSMKTDNLGGSGLSAQDMGQFPSFDEDNFKKMTKETSKLNYMLGYKATLK